MNTLFDIEPVLPEGICYCVGFITEVEERRLVEIIQGFHLQQMKFHEYEVKRKVINFGKGWSFTEQILKDGNAIPEAFDFLIERIAGHLDIPTTSIAQFLITEYPVGSVINWHRMLRRLKLLLGFLYLRIVILN